MPRRQITLSEWEPAEVVLSADDALALSAGAGEIKVTPLGEQLYRVEPSHWVGTVALAGVDIVVRPKVGVERLFYMLSYSPRLRFRELNVPLDGQEGITESIIRAFLTQMVFALRRGPLMFYRGCDDALPTVRGRVRLLDQARRRFNFLLPVEVSFDEFTSDIEENRILKAALRRSERTRLRDSRLRHRVGAGLEVLAAVSDIRYDSRQLPDITFTRLNRHYEPSIVLAKAIISSTTPDLRHGQTATPSFMIDMDKVFEDFIYRAVADELSVGAMKWKQGRSAWLDDDGRVRIKPDLSLWQGAACRFVGDVKYKQTNVGENTDIYQVIAYAQALGQNDALLIYAEAEPDITHVVRRDGIRIHLHRVKLDVSVELIDAQIAHLARTIEQIAGGKLGLAAPD